MSFAMPVKKFTRREKLYDCEKCKNKFASKFSMLRHSKYCGVEPQRVDCTNCKKSLKSLDVLQKHIEICYGRSKKLACGLCDDLFCSTFSLKRHMWRFHNETEFHQNEVLRSMGAKLENQCLNTQIRNDIIPAENRLQPTNDSQKFNILNYRIEQHSIAEYCYRFIHKESEEEYTHFDSVEELPMLFS